MTVIFDGTYHEAWRQPPSLRRQLRKAPFWHETLSKCYLTTAWCCPKTAPPLWRFHHSKSWPLFHHCALAGLAANSFFSACVLQNINDLPHQGGHLSFLTETPFSQTLEGLFEPTLSPSTTLNLASLNITTITCGALGPEVPEYCQNSWRKPWLSVCKKTLLCTDPWLQKANRMKLG